MFFVTLHLHYNKAYNEEYFVKGEDNMSPEGKENEPSKIREPPRKKRKRIILLESDDSAGDETFAPSKQVGLY